MKFIIHAAPKPKGRPRVTRSGHAFTPKATREYEQLIVSEWEIQHGKATPIENPIAVRVMFYMPIPKATSNKARERMAAGLEVPVKKPDIDNLLKAVLDALNGKAYQDDNQIVDILAEKRYSDEPRTEVFISEIIYPAC
jgi:Holliday junction resolvase RusA-like endonuclease